MSISSNFLGVGQSLESYQIGITVAAAIYAGIFLMLSNHYIFRPKVEDALIHSSVQSKALQQLIIDFVSNLPQLTFLICTLTVSTSDSGLSVIVYSDVAWSGLYVGLLAFRILSSKQTGNWRLMLIKNISFLGLIYVSIIYMVSLGIIMFLVYFANLMMDAHEDKFISAMQYLFNYKPEKQNNSLSLRSSKMVSLEYLARNFPVSPEDIKEKMRNFDKDVKNIKIKTKSLVAQKLMKIALTVHLSKQKLEAKAKRDIKNYYGTFNGTVAERSRRLIVEKHTTADEICSQSQPGLKGEMIEGEEVDSFIFYIFPIKVFESSKLLSVCFSISINIGYGVLLSLTVFMTDNLANGVYAHLIYGFLLLPLLPNASKADFYASMSISSLWKYCLYGVILSSNCLISGSASFSLNVSGTLTFSPLIQLIAIILLTYMLVTSEHSRYRIIFVWVVVVALNVILMFKLC